MWNPAADAYDISRLVLTRGLAVVFFVAFLNVRNQFPALLGERGLSPAPGLLSRVSFRQAPSLFHFHYSDRVLLGVAWGGMGLAAGVAVGLADLVPLWASTVWWLAMWALYLSVVNIGQTFYGFGWESLLLEAGFYAAFLGNAATAPPLLVLFLFRWLLFRVEFGAGLIKMRGDRCWRDLTCLDYHHETQPMPNPASRWFHHLPHSLHRTEVLANHFAQLVAPLALFFPQPIAGAGAAVMVLTQGYLMISGNYAWLNLTTLLLALAAIPDPWFGASIGGGAVPVWHGVLAVALAFCVAVLSYWPVRNLLGGRQLMNFAFNRYHLVNTYGAFGSVTRNRREVILEGSPVPAPKDGDWRAYEFKAKPGDPRRVPAEFAPYHLRLDWLMWFVALSPSYGRGWLDTLVQKLLEGDRAIARLLATNPFPDRPPELIRGRIVDYRFSDRAEKRSRGLVWVTGPSRPLFGPVSLSR